MKLAYQNYKFTIYYGDSVKEEYSDEIKRVDNVFYVQTDGLHRYTEDDAIRMLELILLNVIYDGERCRIKRKIVNNLHLREVM